MIIRRPLGRFTIIISSLSQQFARAAIPVTIGKSIGICFRKFVSVFTVGFGSQGILRTMFSFTLTHPVIATLATISPSCPSRRSGSPNLINRVHQVSAFTIIAIIRQATTNIFRLCHRFNMFRINARRHATEMVAVQVGINETDKQGIVQTVNQPRDSANTHRRVFGVVMRVPQPTLSFISRVLNGDVRKQACKQFTRNRNTVIISNRHSVYSFAVNGLARLIESSRSLWAVSILPYQYGIIQGIRGGCYL